MSSLLSDDHYCTMCNALLNQDADMRRIPQGMHKRLLRIRQIMRKNDFSDESRFAKLAKSIREHFLLEAALGKDSKTPMRLPPPNDLLGNTVVWKVFRKLMDHRLYVLASRKHIFLRTKATLENSIMSANYRSSRGGASPNKAISTMIDYLFDLSILPAIEACVSEEFKEARSSFNRKYKEWSKTGFNPNEIPKIDFKDINKVASFEALSFGPIMVIKLGRSVYALTEEHTHKLIMLMKSWTSITLSLPSTTCRMKPFEFLVEYLDVIRIITEEDTDFLGEVLKGARTLLISKLDTSNVIGVDMYYAALKAMQPERRRLAGIILSFMRSAFVSVFDAINMLNIYKAIPHPDTNLCTAFNNIRGLDDPNPVSPKMLPRFRGTLRRAVYRSLATSSHDVRLETLEQSAESLVNEANKTQRSIAQVCDKSTTAWSFVTFQPVRTITKPSDIILNPSDKSSQCAPEFSMQDLEDCESWAKGEGPIRVPDFAREAHTINDAASHLKGEGSLNTKKAIKRFQDIISLHTEFESKYPGLTPEDIPNEDLKKFIESNPKARYLVGTEPKLGEYHKKVTRIFYMAEQDLKVITQITERIARQISRKQNGVSIVKGYAGRRKDLESFCDAVTGNEADRQSVFTSFDMSEFSKKFPMTLVREYGDVLAEITGERWLSRIDLVFRAAVVIHNTRGYFAHLHGVEGGFEGFLNFVWSSIHAVVMEVALRSTGLNGMILTFSDDGLLLYYSPRVHSEEDNHKRIENIRTTYLNHGLTFHLGKTLISAEVWEYLGDVCYHGHLIPMWMKEISSLGTSKNSRGITPLRMRIASLEGQVASAISAGADPLISYTILRFWAATYLSNFTKCDDNRFIEALLITPTSLGGMRIRSPHELCVTSDIDVMAEYIADLKCLSEFDSHLARSIADAVGQFTAGVQPRASRLMMGTLVSSNLPDTSGLSVISKAIDIIISEAPKSLSGIIGRNPLDASMDMKISMALSGVENIDHKALSRLLMALPAWIKYTKSMALVRGSGAIRLIRRSELKRLQSEDTKKCLESFRMWRDAINSGQTYKGDVANAIENAIARQNRGFRLIRMKKAFRTLFRITNVPEEASIVVRSNMYPAVSPYDIEYREPKISFPNDSNSMAWFSEATGDIEISSARKFQSVCAAYLSYSPESLPFLRYIGFLFDCRVPNIPAGITRGFHRRSQMRNAASDVRLVMPRAFWSTSSVNFTNDANSVIRGLKRGDRVTYLEYARLSSLFALQKGNIGAIPRDEIPRLVFYACNLDDLVESSVVPELLLNDAPHFDDDDDRYDARATNEFIASIEEHLSNATHTEMLERMAWEPNSDDLADMTSVILICTNTLTRWIHDVVLVGSSPILPLKAIPTIPALRSIVIRRSIITAMWQTLEPRTRGIVGSNMKHILDDFGQIKQDAPDFVIDGINLVGTHLSNILNTLSDLNHPIMNQAEIDRVKASTVHTTGVICECVLTDSIFTDDQVVVVRSNSSQPNFMSEAHRVAFRRIFSSSITAMTNAVSNQIWNRNIGVIIRGMGVDADGCLDWLYICRPLIRASDHRTNRHPYNRKSAMIQLVKFYLLLKVARNRQLQTESEMRELFTNFRLTNPQKVALRRELERNNQQLGEDHLRMLDDGIDSDVERRFLQHARELKEGRQYFKIQLTTISHIVSQLNADLTAYYEKVILRAVGLIVEVPTSFIADIDNLPTIAPSTQVELTQAEVYGEYMSGTEMPSKILSSQNPARELMCAHLANFCVRAGIVGLSPSPSTPSWVTNILASTGHLLESGPKVDNLGRHIPGGVNTIARYFLSAAAAFSSFVTLSRVGVSSMSLLRNPKDGRYYILGFASSREYVFSDENVSSPRVLSEQRIEDFISTITFTEELTATNIGLASLTRRMGPVNSGAAFHNAVATYTRELGASHTLNENSIFLQAAADIARDTGDNSERLWAYSLFIHWTRNDERLESAMNTYRRLRAKLNGPQDTQSSQLLLDLSHFSSYLRMIPVFPGDDINIHHVDNVISSRPEQRLMINVPPSLSLVRMRPLRETIDMVERGEMMTSPGKVMSAMVQIERMPLMILPSEEEEDIRAEDVDLDNFF